MQLTSTTLLVLSLSLAALVGCGSGTETITQVDAATLPRNPTFSEHIAPIMKFYCGACHVGDATPNSGCETDLPGELFLGSRNCVRSNYSEIMSKTFNSMSMPPGAGLRPTPREEAILERWKDQGYAS